MIYLRTGANGAGKTLLTLRDVREKSVKESRPVCYNGRFEMVSDFGWKKIDAKDWQAEPDGTIFLFDECHNDFPTGRARGEVPEYIRMLAEHRRRGFDFYMITQHPLNIDPFLRRLIGSPGWHQHLKRASGAPLVSVLEWPSVNDVCQKAGAGESGSVSMVPFPKEVYSWYASTSLDTAKVKIPFQLKVLVVCVLAVPLLGYYGWQSFMKAQPKADRFVGAKSIATAPLPSSGSGAVPVGRIVTASDYLESYVPRVAGLAYTAPRYDDLAKPVRAPFPAGCVASPTKCDCYTSQGTKLPMADGMCSEFITKGFFRDYDDGTKKEPAAGSLPAPVSRAAPLPVAAADSLPSL